MSDEAFSARASAPSRPPRTPLSRALLLLRFVVPVLLIGWMLHKVPIHDVLESSKRVPLSAIATACAIMILTTGVATWRWQILFGACGVKAKPRFLDLFRIYWIGIFYNTFVPGGLGGDFMRAFATRRIVGSGGIALSGAIAFLERVLGLTGMVIVVATGFTLFPLKGVGNVMLYSGLGITAAVAAVTGIVCGARFAPHLPAPLARIAASLPTIESWPLFVLALALSLVTQSSGVVVGHLLISPISAKALWTDSVVVMPLILASQYFPLTVGGAGVREVAFVVFYGAVGVSKPDALAASFMVMGVQWLTNATGGILHAIRPITLEEDGGAVAAADEPPLERAS
jgi:uncharacterized membrane protein YbhN (UPF0104 family)